MKNDLIFALRTPRRQNMHLKKDTPKNDHVKNVTVEGYLLMSPLPLPSKAQWIVLTRYANHYITLIVVDRIKNIVHTTHYTSIVVEYGPSNINTTSSFAKK